IFGGFDLGGGGGGAATLLVLTLGSGSGSLSLAAWRETLVGLRFLGSTATSSDAPQSFAPRLRRKSSTSSGFPTGPFSSIPKIGLPLASVRPTLPKRRLLGLRTRERTSFKPRLRALSASSSMRGSLIICPPHRERVRRARRPACR